MKSFYFQISDNVTAILGGSKSPFIINVFDWATNIYTTNPFLLLRSRIGSACAVIKGTDGFSRVAVIGGESKGMEIWNPNDGTIEMVTDELPLEETSTKGIMHSEALAINEGSEVLLFGGNKGSDHQGIWKYSVTENTWTRVGSLLAARSGHIVLPITNVSCSAL